MKDRKEDEQRIKDNIEDDSHNKLAKAIESKVTTIIIGTLAEFEQCFGDLWGHDVDENDKTQNQIKWADRWEQTRNNILNKSHNRLRSLLKELDSYKVKWQAFKIEYKNIETGGR